MTYLVRLFVWPYVLWREVMPEGIDDDVGGDFSNIAGFWFSFGIATLVAVGISAFVQFYWLALIMVVIYVLLGAVADKSLRQHYDCSFLH